MRFTATLLALSAAFSSANAALLTRQNLPSCAVSCLTNADFGGCSQTDDTCLCHNQTFISSTTTCITSSCTGSDLVAAEQYAQAICLAVGVTLTATVPASTATGSTAASTATTPTTSTISSSTATSTPTHSSGASLSYGINFFAGAVAAAAFGAGL